MPLQIPFEALIPSTTSLPNGVSLAHVRAGSGPVLVFIHGAMGDWRSWEPQWAAFTAQYDCISYSRRYSHPNPNTMPSPDHSALIDAEDLLGLLDALAISRAILVGSSYGGFTALAAAVRAPEKVAALVAVEPPMMRYARMSDEGRRIADDFHARCAGPARDAFARGDDIAGAMILSGGIANRPAGSVTAQSMGPRLQNILAAKRLALSSDEFPLLEPAALAALPMPVLLMSGAQTAPVHAAIFGAVRTAMPQAQARIVEGSGHSVSRQRSDVFNTEALAFLDEVLTQPAQG
ncbi:MAG: alpha/beta hydrolase [Cypionkella sp.]|nr:alpha/beta hydrolase [Cypionkella sp.]